MDPTVDSWRRSDPGGVAGARVHMSTEDSQEEAGIGLVGNL